jgi:hypothetical protein
MYPLPVSEYGFSRQGYLCFYEKKFGDFYFFNFQKNPYEAKRTRIKAMKIFTTPQAIAFVC